MGAAFNAAKEKALDAFLARQIGFLQMSEVVKSVIDTLSDTDHGFEDALNLEHILGMDAWPAIWPSVSVQRKINRDGLFEHIVTSLRWRRFYVDCIYSVSISHRFHS